MTNGSLAHFAINADDVDRARRFYEKAFGWKFNAWGPPQFFMIEGAGTLASLQGRRELVAGATTVGFECTIAVDSIEATEKAILAAGGSIAMARSVIVGVGTLMFFRDTEGNVFGAMQYDSRAE
jgi:predicted enzyme related to lactoylglutathione lyase